MEKELESLESMLGKCDLEQAMDVLKVGLLGPGWAQDSANNAQLAGSIHACAHLGMVVKMMEPLLRKKLGMPEAEKSTSQMEDAGDTILEPTGSRPPR